MAKASATESKTPSAKPAKAAKPEKMVKKPGKAAKPARPNIFKRLGQYFRDVRSETKRVVWPSRNEVVNSSVVVVVTLIFFVVFTLLVDTIVVPALQLLSGLG